MSEYISSHSAWRFIVVSVLVLSFCLGGISPANAADVISIMPLTSFEDGSYPAGLVYGPDQAAWFALSGTGSIGWFSAAGVKSQPLPDLKSRPLDITLGSDQALWFSEESVNQIGRLMPGGEVTEYSLGAEQRSPTAVVLGQDLAVWFTEFDGNRIGRISTDGVLTEFILPHPDSKPQSMASAVDGSLWFTEWGGYRIGRITLKGEISEYDIPNPPARPTEILFGPDGNLWVLLNTGKSIIRFNPLSQTFDQYLLTTQSSSLSDLTIGPDNHIWFVGTKTFGNFELVGGIPANLHEELLGSPIYTYSGRSQIISGPDNDLIFTAANSSTIFRSAMIGSPALRDLQIFITYQPPLLLSAGNFNIDTQIVNWTNTAADNVEIDLHLDEGIHFVSTDLVGGSCVDHGVSVHCTIPSIGAGAALPMSFIMRTDRLQAYSVDRTIGIEVFSAEGDYQPANNRVVLFKKIQKSIDYFTDFANGADPYWSTQKTSNPMGGNQMLGLFDNDQVTFDYKNLPPHDSVHLCFDLNVMGPWDGSQYLAEDDQTLIGPDLWANYINDNRLLLTSFSNQEAYVQAFPNSYPDKSSPFQTGSMMVGEFDGNLAVKDARYHFCYQVLHRNLSLNIFFKGLNLDGLDHEKWAIDDVRIQIYNDASFDDIYLPMVVR